MGRVGGRVDAAGVAEREVAGRARRDAHVRVGVRERLTGGRASLRPADVGTAAAVVGIRDRRAGAVAEEESGRAAALGVVVRRVGPSAVLRVDGLGCVHVVQSGTVGVPFHHVQGEGAVRNRRVAGVVCQGPVLGGRPLVAPG
jgi:hypothetical protein